MSHVEREFLKLAVEIYGEALRNGKRFSVTELAEELARTLLERWADENSIAQELIVAQAHAVMGKVDKQRTRTETQAALIDDLDRPIALDGGQRIVRRRMRANDWVAHIGNVSENAARVVASAEKEYARHAALVEHLDKGLDTEAALAAWQAANPEADLP